MPNGLKKEPAPPNHISGGKVRREEHENLELHNWHESHHRVHRKQGTHVLSVRVLVNRSQRLF